MCIWTWRQTRDIQVINSDNVYFDFCFLQWHSGIPEVLYSYIGCGGAHLESLWGWNRRFTTSLRLTWTTQWAGASLLYRARPYLKTKTKKKKNMQTKPLHNRINNILTYLYLFLKETVSMFWLWNTWILMPESTNNEMWDLGERYFLFGPL